MSPHTKLTRGRTAFLLTAALLFATPAALTAQGVVGYPPERSPYRDVPDWQRITFFGGYFIPQKDEIGATPRSGPIAGFRYEVSVGGPAQFVARAAYVASHRAAFDPTRPQATRSLGDVRQALYLADVGFALNLTGQKSWHHIIPVTTFGLGVITGPGTAARDPYRFGTQFAISSAIGVRIVPAGTYELRLEAGSTLYQSRYPGSYFISPDAATPPLLGARTARSGFRNAWSLTAGLAVPIFR